MVILHEIFPAETESKYAFHIATSYLKAGLFICSSRFYKRAKSKEVWIILIVEEITRNLSRHLQIKELF